MNLVRPFVNWFKIPGNDDRQSKQIGSDNCELDLPLEADFIPSHQTLPANCFSLFCYDSTNILEERIGIKIIVKRVAFVFVFVVVMKCQVNYQSIFGQTLVILISILYSFQICQKQIRESNRFVLSWKNK